VIVAVAGVGVVQMTIHQVVHMVPVGGGLMATPGAVAVGSIMPSAGVLGRAPWRVPSVLWDAALVHMP
jgi:hypothetical protein